MSDRSLVGCDADVVWSWNWLQYDTTSQIRKPRSVLTNLIWLRSTFQLACSLEPLYIYYKLINEIKGNQLTKTHLSSMHAC
jgi:hypothetical protein